MFTTVQNVSTKGVSTEDGRQQAMESIKFYNLYLLRIRI